MKLSYRSYRPLGVTATSRRNIKSGEEYDKSFSRPKKKDPFLTYLGTTHNTLDFMKQIVHKTLGETKKLAPLMKGATLEETCNKIWHFAYNHYQYKLDKPTEEELRSPSRAWHDRKEGIDCDCFAITISSILSNLKIPHALRMAKYDGKSYFQHVYVVVPRKPGLSLDNTSNYFTIDPVLNKPNYEKPYSEKFDKIMMPIRFLNGIEEENTDQPQQMGNIFKKVGNAVKNTVSAGAKAVAHTVTAPIKVTKALVTTKGDIGDKLKAGGHAAVAPVKSVVKDHVTAVKAVHEVNKAVAKGAADVGKKVFQAVKKITVKGTFVLPRAGLLLAMKLNIARMAERLGYGYWTEEEAKSKKLDLEEWKKIKEKLAKTEKIFKNIGGEPENLKKAILDGWKHGVKKHNLLHGLAGTYGLGRGSLSGLGEITDEGYRMLMGCGCDGKQSILNGLRGTSESFTPEEIRQLNNIAINSAGHLISGIGLGRPEEELGALFKKKAKPLLKRAAMTPREALLLARLFQKQMNGLSGTRSEIEVLTGVLNTYQNQLGLGFLKNIASAIKKVTSAPPKSVAAAISLPIKASQALVQKATPIAQIVPPQIVAPKPTPVQAPIFIKPVAPTPEPGFDEHYYLQSNPDVAAAVAKGDFVSGYAHYLSYGKKEGRKPAAPALPPAAVIRLIDPQTKPIIPPSALIKTVAPIETPGGGLIQPAIVKTETVNTAPVAIDLNRVLPQDLEYLDNETEITIDTDDYDGLEIYNEQGQMVLEGLGEPISLVAGTTAAAGFIAAIAGLLKGIKSGKLSAEDGAAAMNSLVSATNSLNPNGDSAVFNTASDLLKTASAVNNTVPSVKSSIQSLVKPQPGIIQDGEAKTKAGQILQQITTGVRDAAEHIQSQSLPRTIPRQEESTFLTPTNMMIGGVAIGGLYLLMKGKSGSRTTSLSGLNGAKSKKKANSKSKIKTIKI